MSISATYTTNGMCADECEPKTLAACRLFGWQPEAARIRPKPHVGEVIFVDFVRRKRGRPRNLKP